MFLYRSVFQRPPYVHTCTNQSCNVSSVLGTFQYNPCVINLLLLNNFHPISYECEFFKKRATSYWNTGCWSLVTVRKSVRFQNFLLAKRRNKFRLVYVSTSVSIVRHFSELNSTNVISFPSLSNLFFFWHRLDATISSAIRKSFRRAAFWNKPAMCLHGAIHFTGIIRQCLFAPCENERRFSLAPVRSPCIWRGYAYRPSKFHSSSPAAPTVGVCYAVTNLLFPRSDLF